MVRAIIVVGMLQPQSMCGCRVVTVIPMHDGLGFFWTTFSDMDNIASAEKNIFVIDKTFV